MGLDETSVTWDQQCAVYRVDAQPTNAEVNTQMGASWTPR